MAMTREDAANYAAAEFAELLLDAGLTAAQDGGLQTAMDRAMRMLSIPLLGPIPDEKENAFYAVFDWTILARIERAMANRVDITVDGPNQSKRHSQAVEHVRKLKDEAWTRAESFLAGGETDDAWEFGSISLGLIARPMDGVW